MATSDEPTKALCTTLNVPLWRRSSNTIASNVISNDIIPSVKKRTTMFYNGGVVRREGGREVLF